MQVLNHNVLLQVLNHDVNEGYEEFRNAMVMSVNGVKVSILISRLFLAWDLLGIR